MFLIMNTDTKKAAYAKGGQPTLEARRAAVNAAIAATDADDAWGGGAYVGDNVVVIDLCEGALFLEDAIDDLVAGGFDREDVDALAGTLITSGLTLPQEEDGPPEEDGPLVISRGEYEVLYASLNEPTD